MPLLEDGHEQVNAEGRTDLDTDGVLRGAVESLDAQMLLEPFEEQFDLPAAAVELGDGQGRFAEVIDQEHQQLAGLRIAEADAAHRNWIILPGIEPGQDYCLVKAQAGGLVHGAGVTAAAARVTKKARAPCSR